MIIMMMMITISSKEGSGLWPISSIMRCNGNCPENVGTFIPNDDDDDDDDDNDDDNDDNDDDDDDDDHLLGNTHRPP